MATSKVVVLAAAIVLCFVACESLVSDKAQQWQCRLDTIRARPPWRRIESEGGITEVWDEADEGFQCAGVAAFRHIISHKSMTLPNFHSSPLLIYIHQGEGFMGMNMPGCAETYEAQAALPPTRIPNDVKETYIHQQMRRVQRDDIIAVPAGTVQWFFNHAAEDLIAVAFMDLANVHNQLDLRMRSSYLAGGSKTEDMANMFSGFDQELLAEAYNIPSDLAGKMQQGKNRGVIVKCNDDMSFLSPEEREEELSASTSNPNGLEETICTARVIHNMNTHKEADIYSREAGRVHILSQHKLPLLKFMGMGAEKGHLFPNAQYNLQWSMTEHRLVYVVEGEAEVQIADDHGNRVFSERVSKGNMFVIPQFYASLAQAGPEGFEWIAFETSNQPMKSPVAGYTSLFRTLPLHVLEQAFQMTTTEAKQLKQTRSQHTFLFPPSSSSSKSS